MSGPIKLDLIVVDIAVRELRCESGIQLGTGRSKIIVNTEDLDSGSYQLILQNNKNRFQKQFTVVRWLIIIGAGACQLGRAVECR